MQRGQINTSQSKRGNFYKERDQPPLLIETGGVNFQEFMIPFWKHRDQGRHLRQISEEDQSVAIQLPPAEDGDGYLRNIRIKNVSVVE